MNPIASVIQSHPATKGLSMEDQADLKQALIKGLEAHSERVESLFDIDKDSDFQEEVIRLCVITS